MKSVTQMEAIHQQLLTGELTLNYETATTLKNLAGQRFDKREKAVDMAIEADRASGKIGWDLRGADALFDILKQDTQSRFSAFIEGAQKGATTGAKLGGSVGGVIGFTTGAAASAAAGPVPALAAGAIAAVSTAVPPALVGAAALGLGQGAWYAIRN